MPLIRVDNLFTDGGYRAEIGYSEVNVSGEIRVSPPFTPGEQVLQAYEDTVFDVRHLATTETATAFTFTLKHGTNEKEYVDTAIQELRTATESLVEVLSRVQRGQQFHDHWTGNRK